MYVVILVYMVEKECHKFIQLPLLWDKVVFLISLSVQLMGIHEGFLCWAGIDTEKLYLPALFYLFVPVFCLFSFSW